MVLNQGLLGGIAEGREGMVANLFFHEREKDTSKVFEAMQS